MHKIKPYWKAVVSGIVSGSSVIGTSVLPESDGGAVITGSEWVTVIVTAVLTTVAVYAKGDNRVVVPAEDGEHRA